MLVSKTKAEESTLLTYTGLLVELEHLKIKTTFPPPVESRVTPGNPSFLRKGAALYILGTHTGVKSRCVS